MFYASVVPFQRVYKVIDFHELLPFEIIPTSHFQFATIGNNNTAAAQT
jgi:hypothetical protein